MRRDWDIIRGVLLALEEERLVDYTDNGCFNDPDCAKAIATGKEASEVFGEYRRLVMYNTQLLLDEGFISSSTLDPDGINDGYRLTMKGHDLLDTLRDRSLWKTIKTKAASSGRALSWEFIKAILPILLKSGI